MATKVCAVIDNINEFANGENIILVHISSEAGNQETVGFGPYPASGLITSLLSSLKTDIKSYTQTNWGTTFGLFDIVRLYGGIIDL